MEDHFRTAPTSTVTATTVSATSYLYFGASGGLHATGPAADLSHMSHFTLQLNTTQSGSGGTPTRTMTWESSMDGSNWFEVAQATVVTTADLLELLEASVPGNNVGAYHRLKIVDVTASSTKTYVTTATFLARRCI